MADLSPRANEIIAHLLLATEALSAELSADEREDFDNLLWSIISHVKGLDYLSEWAPESDRGVQQALVALRRP